MAQFNFSIRTTAFGDQVSSSNPSRRHFDWSPSLLGIEVLAPKGNEYTLAPGETLAVFSGVRSTAIDGTTQLTLSVSPLDTTRYRFTWTSGTAPALRTDRALALSGQTITVVVNENGTITMTSSTIGAFTAVQVTDIVFIPGVATGDADGPFDDRNSGQWVTLAKDGTNTILQLSRLPDEDFVGYGEAIILVANANLQAWSAAGVQVGDKVKISAGFSTPVHTTFVIAALTSKWFEVIATGTLPVAAVGVPTASGIAFYSKAKRWAYVEMNQEGSVRTNGASDDRDTVQPWIAGDPVMVGNWMKTGPIWSMDLVNLSAVPLTALVLSVE